MDELGRVQYHILKLTYQYPMCLFIIHIHACARLKGGNPFEQHIFWLRMIYYGVVCRPPAPLAMGRGRAACYGRRVLWTIKLPTHFGGRVLCAKTDPTGRVLCIKTDPTGRVLWTIDMPTAVEESSVLKQTLREESSGLQTSPLLWKSYSKVVGLVFIYIYRERERQTFTQWSNSSFYS